MFHIHIKRLPLVVGENPPRFPIITVVVNFGLLANSNNPFPHTSQFSFIEPVAPPTVKDAPVLFHTAEEPEPV